MKTKGLAQQIIEQQCRNVNELIRVSELLKKACKDAHTGSEQEETLKQALQRVDTLIETL
ncbi:hypothetical protein FT641_19790 [Bacillus paranthracis]|uniref:hypothetical protein n=1 Tax=Bacillus paranthracis TaxID=2026186 RepID=UPI001879C8BD|nr:hypothetical protein [Bacillus paranthracis]MBE7114696.1 hypothetical protein [Bacillus paranthracis]MBE7154937.1 hypothetical protein [Bacillus paranthracis]